MVKTLQELQQAYPLFRYVSFDYSFDAGILDVVFTFEVGEHSFTPHVRFQAITKEALEAIDQHEFENFIFHLGLAEMPSYWKATCSPLIDISCGYLDDEQLQFWQELFLKGLGEFYYVNQIKPFTPRFQVPPKELTMTASSAEYQPVQSKKVLVPVGGGKDSIVTLELLVQAGYEITPLTVGEDQAMTNTLELFQKQHQALSQLHVDRVVDPKLLELNKQGFLNGHTPFSSVLAFISLFTARLLQLPSIALSNERSANEETGLYYDLPINHQYSKTFEFEQNFRAYTLKTFGNGAQYFSLLRPLYELQIAKIFTHYPEYFPVFRSCNVGKKDNTWCGHCAKCLFVFLMLSAFLEPFTVRSIFHTDMLDDATLDPLLAQLLGEVPFKAFECIGTRAESVVALYMSYKKIKATEERIPALIAPRVQTLQRRSVSLEALATQMLSAFDTNHAIPSQFEGVVPHALTT